MIEISTMKKLLIKATIIFLALLLCGCGVQENSAFNTMETKQATVFAMDTVMDLTVYGCSDELLETAQNRILQLESLFSVTDENSEIYALNRDKTVKLSEDTEFLLKHALEMCAETDGALDISSYPVVRAWGFTTGQYRIPTEAERAALLEHVDYRKVHIADSIIDGRKGSGSAATIAEEMEVDLGSVAKGYAGDQVVKLLREGGVTSAILNMGGNVQALGSKPEGSDWRVALKDPDREGYLGVLEISNKAVITSGDYDRYFVGEDGNTYWHIIDPVTGAPALSGLTSVTVVGDVGLTCDALSTSLFIMGLEGAADFWRQHGGFDAILVTDDSAIYVTEGLAERFFLTDQYADRELTIIEKQLVIRNHDELQHYSASFDE